MNRLFYIGVWCLFILTFSISGCKKKKEIEKIKFYKVVTLSGSMYAMAVSLDEADLAWSTEYVETNIKDLKNGLNNQMAIQALQLGKVSTLLLNGVLIRIKTVQEVGIFRLLQKCRNCLQFE